ncbi:hypothetical protein V1525DRAFT_41064 [Lipomyces kononenkoae]|uniref:Uncharacterized protein n=1 Tax=Lipomyces kononenkoae TaxID=34357 RepID=A0ACC3STT3_LIPKO
MFHESERSRPFAPSATKERCWVVISGNICFSRRTCAFVRMDVPFLLFVCIYLARGCALRLASLPSGLSSWHAGRKPPDLLLYFCFVKGSVRGLVGRLKQATANFGLFNYHATQTLFGYAFQYASHRVMAAVALNILTHNLFAIVCSNIYYVFVNLLLKIVFAFIITPVLTNYASLLTFCVDNMFGIFTCEVCCTVTNNPEP